MTALRPRGTVSRVDARRPGRTVPPEDRSLFLVEFVGGPPGSGVAEGVEAESMQAALRHAVARLAAAGTVIRWCGGWFLPADRRCLCLVEAAHESCVVLARDTAALTAARVHAVRNLDGRTGTAPPLRARGRS